MSKLGIEIQIDVTKIDKTRLYKGKKGTYLTLTTFVDLNKEDEYGNNGFVTEKRTREESDNKVQLPILGNLKVFYNEDKPKPAPTQNQGQGTQVNNNLDDFDDDMPF